MKDVTLYEKATFVALIAAAAAHLFWIIKRRPGWKNDRFLTSLVFVTALLVASVILKDNTLGNITHTLYGALILMAFVDSRDKDVLLFAITMGVMTILINALFKRCSWAAIFEYSTDYKDRSTLVMRDMSVLITALAAKYFYVARN